MAKAKKHFGSLPEKISVLSEIVHFDAEGHAEVSDEVAATLIQIPGYSVFPEDIEPDGNGEDPNGEDPDAEGNELDAAEDPSEESDAGTEVAGVSSDSQSGAVPKRPIRRATATAVKG